MKNYISTQSYPSTESIIVLGRFMEPVELSGLLCNILYLYLQFYESLSHNPGLNLHVCVCRGPYRHADEDDDGE